MTRTRSPRIGPDNPISAPAPRAQFRLQTLGLLKLTSVAGNDDLTLSARPRKLAVLAWLALRPGQRASRDQLVGMFWGERDDERARNSLSDALSHIRRVLGRNVIRNIADDVHLTDDASLSVDVLELSVAAACNDHARVVALYAGPFLEGVYIDDAPEFDDWRDRERSRLASLFARSADVCCTTLAQNAEWPECLRLAERWLDAEPASVKAALCVLNATNAPGTHESRAAALVAYDRIARTLDHRLGLPPHNDVTLLAREIRAQMLRECKTGEHFGGADVGGSDAGGGDVGGGVVGGGDAGKNDAGDGGPSGIAHRAIVHELVAEGAELRATSAYNQSHPEHADRAQLHAATKADRAPAQVAVTADRAPVQIAAPADRAPVQIAATADRAPVPVATASVPQQLHTSRMPALARLAVAVTVAVAAAIALSVAVWRSLVPALDPHRVVVAEFANHTSDSSLVSLGRVAAIKISRELNVNRIADVIDPNGALIGRTTNVRDISRNAGVGIVIEGSYSERGDSVVIEARIVSAADDRVLHALAPATASRQDPSPAVDAISERVAGALAAELNVVIAGIVREASQPSTYNAYVSYVTALELFSRKQYLPSVEYFRRASTLDSSLVSARIWSVAAYGNAGQMARADSLAQAVNAAEPVLLPLDRALLDFWLANFKGDRQRQYDAGQRALHSAPNSELTLYIAGFAAISVNRPREAANLLARIPADVSPNSWDVYGTRYSFALHMLKSYKQELTEARRRRAHEPQSVQAIAEEARALVALGALDDANRAITDAATLPAQPTPGRTVGSAMYGTGLEMRAHGHEREARAMFARLIDWAEHQSPGQLGGDDAPMMLARGYYLIGYWQTAEALFRIQLAAKAPGVEILGWTGVASARAGHVAEAERVSNVLATLEIPYMRGTNTMWRARIAAVLDQKEQAITLMRQAMAEGSIIDDIHIWTEFLPLHGYAPYEALVKPID